jgi:hypothetical protein
MAVSVRGVGAFGSGTTSFTAAVPTGGSAPVSGDAMYIVVESCDSTTAAGTPNTPSGWTSLGEATSGAGATGVTTLTIFGKIAGVGEANVTVDGVLNHCAGAMVVIAGHGLNAITDTVVGAFTDHGTTQTDVLAASITVSADSMVLVCMGLSDDANDTSNVSGVTNANLASITEQIDQTVTTGAGGGVGIYTATCAGTSTGTTSWDHDTAERSQSLHLGIRPLLDITGAAIASTAALFAATLAYAMTTAAIAAGSVLYAPTVEQPGGAQEVTGATIASTATVNAPTLAYAVDGATIASTLVVSAPTLAYELAAANIPAGAVVFAPTLAYEATGSTVAAGSAMFAPSLAYVVNAPAIGSTVSLFAPSLAVGPVEVTGAHVSSTAALSSPSVAYVAVGAFVASTVTLSAPALAYEIAGAFIVSGVTLGPPDVSHAGGGGPTLTWALFGKRNVLANTIITRS